MSTDGLPQDPLRTRSFEHIEAFLFVGFSTENGTAGYNGMAVREKFIAQGHLRSSVPICVISDNAVPVLSPEGYK
jgi:hypothetical protein